MTCEAPAAVLQVDGECAAGPACFTASECNAG
jgi:hypothetical protein